MSFLDTLRNITGNVGRGALDVFTLGGNELGQHFGGQGYKNIINPIQTGLGANFEAGAAGGSAMLGAQGMGAFGGGASSAGAGASPSLSLTQGPGSTLMAGSGTPAQAAAPSPISSMLQMSRGFGGGQPQAQPQQDPNQVLNQLYNRYPNLRPHFGGFNNGIS